MLVSIYPLFVSSEQVGKRIIAEGEALFIISKIQYALSESIISEAGEIVSPPEGETGDELTLVLAGEEMFHFFVDESGTFCSAPLLCQQVLMRTNNKQTTPLNTSRIPIEDFLVTHVAPHGDVARYVEISFVANGIMIGPVRYYVHF
jgi:hypothetical protein